MINSQSLNLTEIGKLYKRFILDVAQVINNPQADPHTTVLILVILALFAAILSLLVWLIVSSVFKEKNTAAEALIAKHFEVTSREVWTMRIAFAITVFISLTGVYYFGTQSSVCVRCHDGELAKNVRSSSHKKVACISCHRTPGVDGHIVQVFDYARWLSKFAAGERREGSHDSRLANGSCLRCHSEVTHKTVARWSVKVRHSDFLKEGARCVDCHNGVAHGKALSIVREPSMDKCVMCHNNKKASASCELCHTSKASPTTRKMPEEIIRIDAGPLRNCRGCHPQDNKSDCVRCHGLELPHPEGWVRGSSGGPNQHARLAFLNNELCKRCHRFDDGLTPVAHATDSVYVKEVFCNRCHAYPSPHGSTQRWLKEHGPAALKKLTPNNSRCGRCHDAVFEQRCSTCHNSLCDSCHSDGRKAIDKYYD